jgi:hypothetical protein
MLRTHELLNLNEKKSDRILEEWERYNHKNISDHNPIMARIDIV